MDANKAEVLRELAYVLRRTCSNCLFGEFQGRQEWSTCSKHEYDHQKHSDTKRQLSVNRSGYCTYHKWSDQFNVGLWKEFLEK